ncbi:SlyX family protein [Cycloclasticus sp.]|uniref:SlyX family protein n=1 Tax=Cycloclasticus sp. TaxID=2024830 RepID=UPI000C0D0EA8|nr:SlyX family protein [Cycloclasticus sp.]PHR48538.1 MAG: SlyX protein [Cycloclasticus sp.]
MDERITELEIKVAYQEDTIQQLDRVLCQQQDQIDSLKKQIKELTNCSQDTSTDTKSLFSALDEVPPHY